MGTSLEFLGMARRAGYLVIGEESCFTAVSGKKARVLISASDASDNSVRNARRMAGLIGVPHIIYGHTKDEIGGMVGRGSPGMLAITDAGMAAGFVRKADAESPGEYTEALELLGKRAARALERKREAKAHLRNVRTGKRRKNV